MTPDPDCDHCGGEGVVFVDVAGPGMEHATVDIDCPTCADASDGADDPDGGDEDDWSREVEWEVRE